MTVNAARPDQDPGPDNAAIMLVSFPHQLLHALAALRHDRHRLGIPDGTPANILVWSHRASDHLEGSAFRKIIGAALTRFRHVRSVFPTFAERRSALSPYRTVMDRAAWVRRSLGDRAFMHVYFSHDASADRTAQVLMQAYPGARHVTFGDPPGFLYPSYSEDLPARALDSPVKRLFWKSRLRGLAVLHAPSCAVVALNLCDESARPANVELLPLETLLEVRDAIEEGLQSGWIDGPLCASARGGAEPAPLIFLTGNFTQSELTTHSNELSMYVELCRTHATACSRIVLKPHFGSPPAFTRQLLSRLDGFEVELLSGSLQQVPIEMMSGLVGSGRIVSVSSSSALLAYLFRAPVEHALTDGLIRRYFKRDAWNHMLPANSQILRAMSRLKRERRPDHAISGRASSNAESRCLS